MRFGIPKTSKVAKKTKTLILNTNGTNRTNNGSGVVDLQLPVCTTMVEMK